MLSAAHLIVPGMPATGPGDPKPGNGGRRGRRGNQDAPAGHAALRSNGLPAHTWAICALSAGFRIHDRAARNRRYGSLVGRM